MRRRDTISTLRTIQAAKRRQSARLGNLETTVTAARFNGAYQPIHGRIGANGVVNTGE
jgi:hypothetical protein